LPHIGQRFRKTAAAVSAVAALGLGIFTSLGPATGFASSHREAPLVAADPQVDATDLYAFVSPDNPDMVTLISNWIPFQEPNGGPNYYPWAAGVHYDIDIDNNGDGKADIIYRWTFKNVDKRQGTFLYNNGPVKSLSDSTLLFKQTYTLDAISASGSKRLISDGVAAPSFSGPASIPDYETLRNEAIKSFGGGSKSYVGQADDPFFLDLRVFDLLYGTNLKEAGHDTLSGFNVSTLALQVPKSELALKGDPTRNPVIGVWTTAERQTLALSPGKATATGKFVQVSRLGNPLVNEVVIPSSLKDAFNAISPDVDHNVDAAVKAVTNPELPALIQGIYKIPAPATPRNDLVEIFLTGICKACGPIAADLNSQKLNKDVDPNAFVPAEELRLNMSVPVTTSPNRLGVLAGDLQGFPNGRRLTDDVVDIAVQSVEGAAQTGKLVDALAAGDGVNANDVAFGAQFPYEALPHESAVNETAGAQPAPAPTTQPTGTATVAPASSKGVSSGAATAIAIAVGIGGLLIGAGIAMAMRRRKTNGMGGGSTSDRTMADSSS
jgi:hypothetical protein